MTIAFRHRTARSARAVAARLLLVRTSGPDDSRPYRHARREHRGRLAEQRSHALFC